MVASGRNEASKRAPRDFLLIRILYVMGCYLDLLKPFGVVSIALTLSYTK
jgi:hypothetical protein